MKDLVRIIEEADEQLFIKRGFTLSLGSELVEAIGTRIECSGTDIGAFSPYASDLEDGFRLFTGERLRTKLAVRNVMTADAARLISVSGKDSKLLPQMRTWLSRQCFARGCTIGECAHSTIAYMRFLAVDDQEGLAQYLGSLEKARDGRGRWKGFPYYYTVLALSEISLPEAKGELAYAGKVRSTISSRIPEKYSKRRELLIERLTL